MKQLYFCRHGESERNAQRIFAGRFDTPLTTLGEQQAELAGIQAKSLGIDVIVASPLVRAHKTAEIIASLINYPTNNIIVVEQLVERALGSLEGKSWDDFDEDEHLFPDIETHETLLARAKEVLAYLQNLSQETVLVVGHGSFAIALMTAIDPSQEYAEPENAKIIQLI